MRLTAIGCLLLAGCSLGHLASERAEYVASQQHSCPRERVTTLSDNGNWTYWLDVCGRRRLYDTRGGAYNDITSTVE